MRRFVQFPSGWIHARGLEEFEAVDGVLALKTLFALAIARGRIERTLRRQVVTFPASLDDLSEEAHVARPDASRGVALLVEHGRIIRARGDWRATGVNHRCSFFEFPGSRPFLMFPWDVARASRLLEFSRLRNRRSLSALKVYLLLGAFRNNASGVTRIGYDAMASYGVARDTIKSGLDVLINLDLVGLHRPDERARTNEYIVRGLGSANAPASRKTTSLFTDGDASASSAHPFGSIDEIPF